MPISALETLLGRPFRHYISIHKRTFCLGLICLLFTNALDVLPPLLIGIAIDKITDSPDPKAVLPTLGLLILVTIFLALFRYLWRIFWGRFHHSVGEDLKNRLFDKYSELGPSFYAKTSVGELMSLINNDVNSFRMAIGPGILIVLDALLIVCFIPPIMMNISAEWTWKTLILLPLLPFIMRWLMNAIREGFSQQQKKFAELSGFCQELVAGVRVIKSYAQEKNQTFLFNKFSRRYEDACNDVAKVDSLFSPITELGVTSGSVILLFVGAPEVMSGAVSVGAFFAFYQYIQRMIWPMTAIGLSANFIQKGRASFDRIAEVLKAVPDVADTGDQKVEEFQSLEFRNLSFKYPDALEEDPAALKNVSFKLNRGETLGIVGPIGSGKSTLIDLLCRQYPVAPNTILINDIPIEEIDKSSVRDLLGVAPQEAFLFSQKVSENIALGLTEWSENEVGDVARLVNIEDEIKSIPEGYEAMLGEKGVNLSGGQKQRLTMARALIRNADLVILDDSLSAVDANTEKSILAALRGNLGADGLPSTNEVTSIIISHRLASLRWADKILVLKDGSAEAFGTHEELLRTSETYKRIYELQHDEGITGGTTHV